MSLQIDDEHLAGSTVWCARSATARILIAHLVLAELGRTMYSSIDRLDACSNVHHGATDHGAAGNPLCENKQKAKTHGSPRSRNSGCKRLNHPFLMTRMLNPSNAYPERDWIVELSPAPHVSNGETVSRMVKTSQRRQGCYHYMGISRRKSNKINGHDSHKGQDFRGMEYFIWTTVLCCV
jgi:hypothetical protein